MDEWSSERPKFEVPVFVRQFSFRSFRKFVDSRHNYSNVHIEDCFPADIVRIAALSLHAAAISAGSPSGNSPISLRKIVP